MNKAAQQLEFYGMWPLHTAIITYLFLILQPL